MAPRGGYKKGVDRGAEYVRLDRRTNAEAVIMATLMGQEPEVWVEDAARHHLYRCEVMLCQAQYQADVKNAMATNGITPMQYEAKYQPTREKPTITRTTGQGSGPTGRSYKP